MLAIIVIQPLLFWEGLHLFCRQCRLVTFEGPDSFLVDFLVLGDHLFAFGSLVLFLDLTKLDVADSVLEGAFDVLFQDAEADVVCEDVGFGEGFDYGYEGNVRFSMMEFILAYGGY